MTQRRNGKEIKILLVEDNPGDVRLTQEAFKEGKVKNTIYVVSDGIQALDFLRQKGEYANAVRPDLILLDLNLPRKDGREVLEEIKSDKGLRQIPVVILTTSDADKDILDTYDNHTNSYITKPVELDDFFNVVRSIGNFWLSVVKLPNEED